MLLLLPSTTLERNIVFFIPLHLFDSFSYFTQIEIIITKYIPINYVLNAGLSFVTKYF